MKIISAGDILKLLGGIGVDGFFDRLIAALEHDFGRWETLRVSARHGTYYPQGVIELMPCADARWHAFKYVNGHPGNPARGKLCVVALGQLSDAATGYPLLLCDMTLLTALRTAATGALAAKYLARPESSRLAIIGTGAQAEFQAVGFARLFPLREVRYYDPDAAAMAKFARNVAGRAFQAVPCGSIGAAVRNADIVVTATAASGPQNLFGLAELAPGTHIHAMGGDSPGKTELGPELLLASKVVVEYLPQALLEGEVQQLGANAVYAELWELVGQHKPGREDADETTVFDSVGFAVEDFSALRLLHALAREYQLGTELALLPEPADPKDLFGLLPR